MSTVTRIEACVEERLHRASFENVFGGRSSSVVVEVELTDGRVGKGEATLLAGWSGESPRASLILLEDVLRPALLGVPAGAVGEAARNALAANNFLIWAVEAAAIDALGTEAIGRAVPVRGLVGRLGPEAAMRIAGEQTAEGHRRMKVKLNGSREEDAARLRAVRDVAPDVAIVADANQSIPLAELSGYMELFRETSVAGVEQPSPRASVLEHGLPDADGWAWIADESIWGYEDALRLKNGPWHVWTLHPGKCRGEDILQRVVEVAEESGIGIVLGSNMEFGPGAEALCRIAAGLPDSPLVELLGHDLAGPVLLDRWAVRGLSVGGGSIHWQAGDSANTPPRTAA